MWKRRHSRSLKPKVGNARSVLGLEWSALASFADPPPGEADTTSLRSVQTKKSYSSAPCLCLDRGEAEGRDGLRDVVKKNSKNPSHVGWRSETQRVISGSSSRVRRSGLRVNRSEDKPAPEGVSVASRASRLAVWSATEKSHAHKPRERRSTALSNVFPVVEKKSVIYCNMYCQIVYTKCFISVLLINRCTCLFSTKIVCT